MGASLLACSRMSGLYVVRDSSAEDASAWARGLSVVDEQQPIAARLAGSTAPRLLSELPEEPLTSEAYERHDVVFASAPLNTASPVCQMHDVFMKQRLPLGNATSGLLVLEVPKISAIRDDHGRHVGDPAQRDRAAHPRTTAVERRGRRASAPRECRATACATRAPGDLAR